MKLSPLTFVGPPEWDEEAGRIEAFKFKATMLHGDYVFSTNLRFRPNGKVEMMDDKPISEKLAIKTDREVETLTLKAGDS